MVFSFLQQQAKAILMMPMLSTLLMPPPLMLPNSLEPRHHCQLGTQEAHRQVHRRLNVGVGAGEPVQGVQKAHPSELRRPMKDCA